MIQNSPNSQIFSNLADKLKGLNIWYSKFKLLFLLAGVSIAYKVYTKLDQLGLIEKLYNYVDNLLGGLLIKIDHVTTLCLNSDKIKNFKVFAKCIMDNVR